MSVTSSRIGNHRRRLRAMLPIRNWISQASVSHRLYAMGVVIGLMYIIPFVVLGVLRIQQFLLFALWAIPAAMFALGLICEIFHRVVLVWKNPIGKWILGGLIALGSVIATVFSRKVINSVVPLDPALFPTATLVLAIPAAIIVWWFIAILLSVLMQVVAFFSALFEVSKLFGWEDIYLVIRNNWMYRFFFKKTKIQRKQTKARTSCLVELILRGFRLSTPIGRFLGAWVLLPVLGISLVYAPSIFDGRSQAIVTTIVWTEYYQFSNCANHRSSEWVSFIGSDKISVATPDRVQGYVFEVRPCDS